jgi:hypothetical protein
LLIGQETELGSKAYTVTEMLSQSQNGIFTELATGKSIDIYRRDLQKAYVNRLVALIGSDDKGKTTMDMGNDGLSIVKADAKQLAATIRQSIARYSDAVTRDHLEDLYERLERSINPRNS